MSTPNRFPFNVLAHNPPSPDPLFHLGAYSLQSTCQRIALVSLGGVLGGIGWGIGCTVLPQSVQAEPLQMELLRGKPLQIAQAGGTSGNNRATNATGTNASGTNGNSTNGNSTNGNGTNGNGTNGNGTNGNSATATCYWSTLQMGIYQEPNPLSAAIGILPAGAIVLIGPGSGQGWVRLQAPVVGWMLANGLQANPLQGCNGLGQIVPFNPPPTVPTVTPANPPITVNPAVNPAAVNPATVNLPRATVPVSSVPVLCTVTPLDGLAVRNQPILHPRTLIAILQPGLHQFQFSNRFVRLKSSNEVRGKGLDFHPHCGHHHGVCVGGRMF
jgi:hypothetical protein